MERVPNLLLAAIGDQLTWIEDELESLGYGAALFSFTPRVSGGFAVGEPLDRFLRIHELSKSQPSVQQWLDAMDVNQVFRIYQGVLSSLVATVPPKSTSKQSPTGSLIQTG
jgi:hypothetical protein